MKEKLTEAQVEDGTKLLTPWSIESGTAVDENVADLYVFDWLTWANIAKWAAQGAVQWAAGKILDALSAKAGGQDSVFMLKSVFQMVLQGEALRKAEARLDGLTMHLHDYNSAPDLGRLDFLTNESQMLVSELKSLEMSGYKVWLVAIDLQLAIIQERVHQFGDAEKQVIKRIIVSAKPHAEKMNNDHIAHELSKFSEYELIRDPVIRPHPRPTGKSFCRYRYQRKWYVDHCDKLRNAYVKHRQYVENAVRAAVVNPANEVVAEWNTLYDSL